MEKMMDTIAGTGLMGKFIKGITMLMLLIGVTNTDCFAQQRKGTGKQAGKTEAATPATFVPGKESVMRKLWNDHILWTRQYMISEMNGSADKDAIFNRLRQNGQDMAKAMNEAQPAVDEKTMATLLDSTVLMMTKLIFETNLGGVRNGSYETKEALMKHLDRTAVYLNSVNTGWSLPELKLMLQGYLNETHNEIMARKNQIWDADIAAYDRLNNHVMKIADAFATGTIQLESKEQATIQEGKTPNGQKNPNNNGSK